MGGSVIQEWQNSLDATNTEISAASVTERDIDITVGLLLNTDPLFRQRFFSAIRTVSKSTLVHAVARWGLWTPNGESDLVWFVLIDNCRIAVLIENKINAGPQPLQFERYRKRVVNWQEKGLIDESHVVLMSPASYTSTETHLYHRLHYETILSWLAVTPDTLSSELARLLNLGLAKPRSKWTQPSTDSELLSWFDWFWSLAERVSPGVLDMIGRCPTGKNGKNSSWHHHRFESDGFRFRLGLKFARNNLQSGRTNPGNFSNVDLEIQNAGSRFTRLKTAISGLLGGTNISVALTGASISLRQKVPLVCVTERDESVALHAICAVSQLQAWWAHNEKALIEILKSEDE